MKDTAGQRSQWHRMPSPSSQGLQRPLPLREQLLGATAGERARRNLYYYHVKLCCSACQHQINARAGLKGKANFMRNAAAPLQMGSVEPALNSSFHLLQPSHLLGLITKQWKLPHRVPSILRGVVPVPSDREEKSTNKIPGLNSIPSVQLG